MMTTRADMVREIKIAARVAELRRLAERTARAYDVVRHGAIAAKRRQLADGGQQRRI